MELYIHEKYVEHMPSHDTLHSSKIRNTHVSMCIVYGCQLFSANFWDWKPRPMTTPLSDHLYMIHVPYIRFYIDQKLPFRSKFKHLIERLMRNRVHSVHFVKIT